MELILPSELLFFNPQETSTIPTRLSVQVRSLRERTGALLIC
jgi:hypothetical protein